MALRHWMTSGREVMAAQLSSVSEDERKAGVKVELADGGGGEEGNCQALPEIRRQISPHIGRLAPQRITTPKAHGR